MNTYFVSNESMDSTFNTAINLSLTEGIGKNANKQYFCISEEDSDSI